MRKGFTLLELVIVVIVIGILITMALPQFARMAERGRVAKAKVMLDMYRKAEAITFAQTSAYLATPAGLATLQNEIPEIAAADADWAYAVALVAGPPATYRVTATRAAGGGAFAGQTIILNGNGTIDLVASTHPFAP